MKTPKKSILADGSSNRRMKGSERVKFFDDSNTQAVSKSNSRNKYPSNRPLLGYDWIAGVIDLERSPGGHQKADGGTTEFSEDYLKEINEFRRVNREECSGSSMMWRGPQLSPVTPLKKRERSPDPADREDPRILDYTVNSRLFPVAIDGSLSCSEKPGTVTSPRYVRISVSKAVLASPYKYTKSKSSVTTDSLSLRNHSKVTRRPMVAIPKKNKRPYSQSLDLRSSMRLPETEAPAEFQMSTNKSLASERTQAILDESYAIRCKLMQGVNML